MRQNLIELWRFRTLVWALVVRHLSARYRGSVLGFVWSFLNPLCLIAVYALVFRFYIRFDDVEHYTLFLFTGLLPWIWISSGLLEATGAISGSGSLITKAMFPPQILPAVAVLTNLANFVFALPLLLGFMLLSGIVPSVSLISLPIVIVIQLVMLLGMGFALAALNVHYRDIQHILANLLTLVFFLCPILYPTTSVPERFRFTLIFNPLASLMQMYHDIFVDGKFPSVQALTITSLVAVLLFVVGNMIFNCYREDFAELV